MPQRLQIAVPVPLPRQFDYAWTVDTPAPAPGCRVVVEFGRRKLVGVVVAQIAGALEGLKPILEVLDNAPLFDASLWALIPRVAHYYRAPLGEVLATALPVGLKRCEPMVLPERRVLAATPAARSVAVPRGAKRRLLWARLQRSVASEAELSAITPGWRKPVTAWIEAGWVESIAVSPWAPPPILAPAPPPSAAQNEAIASVRAHGQRFGVYLLDGVTGSGKTEVYLRLAADALARGGQVLLLVPEIGLTPRLVARVRERLPGRVAALHSELSEGERVEAWAAAARGEVDVIVGTRSAVWTPLPRLQLVLVDEEHDASYKQQDGIRYHGRDLALMRAQVVGAPALLGSATPSLESLRNVELGRYQRLHLPARVGAAKPPRWRLVDLRGQRLRDGLADTTLTAIGEHLATGGQVLVFKNRRGYAPVLLCHDCGWHAECPDCDTALTLHRSAAWLRCHQCGHQQRPAHACPQCASLALVAQGAGTERLENTLAQAFPGRPLVRLDRDTTARKSSFAAAIDVLLRGEPTLIVGTQMLAKGHHLPAVTLAVIVGVDEGLMSADFRASERLAQLIVQVAGRAGRAERAGEVLLQTHLPEHPLLTTLLHRGYAEYARTALAERCKSGLPPVGHAALLRAEHTDAAKADRFLLDVLAACSSESRADLDISGPLPAPQPRRQGRWRFQLVVIAATRGPLHAFLDSALAAAYDQARDRTLRWSVDVDPINFD
ncbi:MAG: primosomal protein N' [Xanthomonadales bacterium]|nr:Primosomal protein N' [Xanthomonadales bacterium]MCC6593883.1 primosomal protein N' [Xanthomonadales bacterium]MCE7932108.1 primosomal protein N' [Xanthomonadales bacterium PRO6]